MYPLFKAETPLLSICKKKSINIYISLSLGYWQIRLYLYAYKEICFYQIIN